MPDARASRPPLSAGVIAGRFIVEAQLGRGGMAEVYRVRDAKSGKRFALKRAWSSNRKQAAKRSEVLEREFHTLAHLRHPCIIEVYDYGIDDGPFYTMELLDGADLDRGGRVPWLDACALLRDVASSLAILHSRGLIHRDVSARNVRRTADGRAKLIDFGAMTSIGVAHEVIGTAPFMSPEVLQMQALDARADLFSLGVLGYGLLTGRHPYPARNCGDLRDAWRTRPIAPSRMFPEIPAALSALVLQLIALDRGARPQTAAEVMERLCVIAALPMEELPEIARGYLTSPTLVGRQETLLSIRKRMLSLVRGDGGAMLLEGPAGSGRSRMLDACVFEGKLVSALVVRAHAGEASQAWSVARAVTSQLFAMLPEASLEATRLSAGVLAHIIEQLRPDNDELVTASVPERSLILRELREFVIALASQHRLLIAIDDIDRIDEPSMAWLSALVAKSEQHSLLVVGTSESDVDADSAASLALFRSLAKSIALPPLAADETEALMRSVFGAVPNLNLIVGRIHAIAQGNPGATMELAQQMVDQGLARYEAGSWLLPQRLDTSDLPKTLAESLARRLDKLGADARELAEVLCITDADPLPLASYRELTQHRDQERMFLALEALVSARILVASAEHYRFSQHSFVAVLSSRMTPQRKAALHDGVADLLTQTAADPWRRAHHLLEAGRVPEMVSLLCGAELQARLPPLRVLERAVSHAEQSNSLPARDLHRLRMALLSKAALRGEHKSFQHCLPSLLKQLEHDSGLALYRELTDVPESARLSQALALQQRRYLAAPEYERVYDVRDGVRELGRLVGAACSTAGAAFDLELLESLPSLEALLPLSPALQIPMQLRASTMHWLSGRAEQAAALWQVILTRVAEPDHAGLDDAQFERTQLGVLYVLGLFEAVNGIARAEQRAQFLEGQRALRVNAWRVRALLQLTEGDADNSLKSLRRAELLLLQDEQEVHYAGTGAGLQVAAYFLAGDLLGVKRTLATLVAHSEKNPGCQPMRVYGESCYRYLSGDLDGALEYAVKGLTIAPPGRHMAWGFLAAQHIKLLRELGQADTAVSCGQRYAERVEREALTHAGRFVHMETARALAAVGRYAEALLRIDGVIRRVENLGARGLALGVFYEVRASIALAMRDHVGFERYAEQCAREYEKGHNPALSARFARLMDEARQSELVPPEAPAFETTLRRLSMPPPAKAEDNVVSRMLECVDRADRARCALTMFLQSTDSYFGYVYGVRGEQLIALAGLPNTQAEPALEAWMSAWFSAERERRATQDDDAMVTIEPTALELDEHCANTLDGDDLHELDDAAEYIDAEGHSYYAVLLIDERSTSRRVAAVLVLQACEQQLRRRPPLQLLSNIAEQLLMTGDVSGVEIGVTSDPHAR